MWRSKEQRPETSIMPAAVGLAQTIRAIAPADAAGPGGPIARTTTTWPAPESEAEAPAAGKISGSEDLRIDSPFEDPIALKCSRLTVGRRATVTAEVVAREVVVYGNVHGTLRARDRIEIKKNGSVIGDITAARIFIEDGAYFKGKIQIERRKKPRGLPQN